MISNSTSRFPDFTMPPFLSTAWFQRSSISASVERRTLRVSRCRGCRYRRSSFDAELTYDQREAPTMLVGTLLLGEPTDTRAQTAKSVRRIGSLARDADMRCSANLET